MGQVLDAVVEECKVRVSKLVAKVDAEHGDVVRLEVRRGLCVCVWRGEYGRLGTDSCCVRLLLGRWAIAALVASRSPAAEHAGQGQAHPGASGRQRGAHRPCARRRNSCRHQHCPCRPPATHVRNPAGQPGQRGEAASRGGHRSATRPIYRRGRHAQARSSHPGARGEPRRGQEHGVTYPGWRVAGGASHAGGCEGTDAIRVPGGEPQAQCACYRGPRGVVWCVHTGEARLTASHGCVCTGGGVGRAAGRAEARGTAGSRCHGGVPTRCGTVGGTGGCVEACT